MAIIVGGTKVVPVAGDTLIIKDSADANALKEIDFANIGVGNIVLTDTTLLVKTYTMYSDAGTVNAIGTITVTDGVAGTGLSVPDYDNGKDYDQNEVVMEAGIFYRAVTVGTNVGNAPAASPGNWDFIPIGGVATVHDVDAAYALNSIVIVGGAFFTPNVAIVAGGNVAFVEGIAANEWSNILTVPFQLHDADALYANNDVVRVNNALFQANSAIDGTTTAVPFVVGVAVNEWRVLGSVIAVAATTVAALSHAVVRADGLPNGQVFTRPVFIESTFLHTGVAALDVSICSVYALDIAHARRNAAIIFQKFVPIHSSTENDRGIDQLVNMSEYYNALQTTTGDAMSFAGEINVDGYIPTNVPGQYFRLIVGYNPATNVVWIMDVAFYNPGTNETTHLTPTIRVWDGSTWDMGDADVRPNCIVEYSNATALATGAGGVPWVYFVPVALELNGDFT